MFQFSCSDYKTIQFCIEYFAESELPHQSKIIFFNFSSNTWHRCICLVHCLFYMTSKKPCFQYKEILFMPFAYTSAAHKKNFDYQRNIKIKKDMKITKKINSQKWQVLLYHRHDVYIDNAMRVTLAVVKGALLSLIDRKTDRLADRQMGRDRRTDRGTYTTHWGWHWQWLQVPCYHWQHYRCTRHCSPAPTWSQWQRTARWTLRYSPGCTPCHC